MFMLVFLCIVFFTIAKSNETLDVKDSTPEHLISRASVITPTWFCEGILVTQDYVIAPATCVYDAQDDTVLVQLGSLQSKPQNINSTGIIIHEDFEELPGNIYINNIAIIILSTPAKLSKNVQPGKFIAMEETDLLEGKQAVISGWSKKIDKDFELSTIKIQNQDMCSYIFGGAFLRSQELCYKHLTEIIPHVIGDLVKVDNKIIGFAAICPACALDESYCNNTSVFLSIAPFLDWMSTKMNVTMEQLTQNVEVKEGLSEVLGTEQKENLQQKENFQQKENLRWDVIKNLVYEQRNEMKK